MRFNCDIPEMDAVEQDKTRSNETSKKDKDISRFFM
jgi:hypothetical protein